VNEDHRERHLAVVGADEFVAMLGVVKVVSRDHRPARLGHPDLLVRRANSPSPAVAAMTTTKASPRKNLVVVAVDSVGPSAPGT